MKLIEKETNRVAEIHMYIVDDDMVHKSMDISADFFDTEELIVTDVDYCVDYVKDWVYGKGDFVIGGDMGYRIAEINGELFANYDI